ncbi:hypothetical protein M3S04_03915 [Xanthomonas sp. PPL139]|uniref:hypothetical protein n=1 Tax=unclassified Xanthomonas TaxID=2643310 RepID=UPI0033B91497
MTMRKSTASPTKRINFKTSVAKIIRERVDGKCSVPRCKNAIRGPAAKGTGSINLGMACHIYSAALGGPRGQGGKDKAFIASAENGLWCCQIHGTAIDKNSGEGYSPDQLFTWKALAEARAAKLITDTPSPLGWIDAIEVRRFPNATSLPKLELSRYTLVAGVPECGQSSLLDLAGAVTQSAYAQRFIPATPAISLVPIVEARLTYTTVDALDRSVDVQVLGDDIHRALEGKPCLLPPGDIQVIYATLNDLQAMPHEDDVAFLLRLLGVDRSALKAIAKAIDLEVAPGRLQFRDGVEEDDHGVSHPRCTPSGESYVEAVCEIPTGEVTLKGLSTSEQRGLILALLIAKAEQISRERLTLLIVEDLIVNFDSSKFKRLLAVLGQMPFQVLVAVPPARYSELMEIRDDVATLKPNPELSSWRLRWLKAPIQNLSP